MDPSIREYLHIIEDLMNEGDSSTAIEILQEMSKNEPENYHIASLLGECFLMAGQPEKAIKPLKWATKTFPIFQKQIQLKQNLEEYEKENQHEEITVSAIRQSLKHETNNKLWVDHYLLGCAYGRCLKFRPAIKHLNIADKMNPKNTEIMRNIGWIRCMQEKTQDGRNLLKKAISIDPKNALAYNDLGASYMFEQKLKEAEKWIKKARKMDPNDDFIRKTEEKLEELQAYKILKNKKILKKTNR